MSFEKSMKRRSVNESEDRFQALLDNPTRFDGKRDEDAINGVMYWSKEHRFAWKIVFDRRRRKSSIHIFKPDVINVAGKRRFGWREYRVGDDHKTMEELDFFSFPSKEAASMAFKRMLLNSVVTEDKTKMIGKLVLPDIEDEGEKDDYKRKLADFFKSHSNFENKIDWNKYRTLTRKDFDSVMASAEKTKGAQKRREKKGKEGNIL